MLRRRPRHNLLLLQGKPAHATIFACFRPSCFHLFEREASMYGQASKFVRVRIPLGSMCRHRNTSFFEAPHRPSRCTMVPVDGRASHTIPASFLACDWWEHPTSWLPRLDLCQLLFTTAKARKDGALASVGATRAARIDDGTRNDGAAGDGPGLLGGRASGRRGRDHAGRLQLRHRCVMRRKGGPTRRKRDRRSDPIRQGGSGHKC